MENSKDILGKVTPQVPDVEVFIVLRLIKRYPFPIL